MATKQAAQSTQSAAAKEKMESITTGTKIPTAMISKDLYADIVRLAAYNKIKKMGPQSDSAILRESLSALMKHVGFKPGETDILAAPKPAYSKKLSAVHQQNPEGGGVRKTFSVSAEDFEAAEEFAAYNKLHGLLPKNLSQLCRDALAFYIDSIDYTFRPE